MENQDIKTFPLRKPVTIEDQTVSEITLREPEAGELERANMGAATTARITINLISIVAKISEKVAGRLCRRDFDEASDFLATFIFEMGDTPSEDEKVIQLRKPITLGEKTISEIKLREPFADELDQAQAKAKNAIGVSINLIAIVGGISRPVAAKLCQRDFMEVAEYLSNFTATSPKTGAASSPN